jgi:endonuclease YncB( thermonuclease family)
MRTHSRAALRTVGLAAITAVGLLAPGCARTGDTKVVNGSTVVVRGSRISLHQIVAPSEGSPKCDAEKQAALKVRERLEALFASGKEIEVRKSGMACLDVTTCDGFVTVDGEDVGDLLSREGLVVNTFQRGDAATPYDWCATPREPLPPAPQPSLQVEDTEVTEPPPVAVEEPLVLEPENDTTPVNPPAP